MTDHSSVLFDVDILSLRLSFHKAVYSFIFVISFVKQENSLLRSRTLSICHVKEVTKGKPTNLKVKYSRSFEEGARKTRRSAVRL